MRRRNRPPYWKPPIDRCDLCGTSLYMRPRWLVKLVARTPAGDVVIRRLHLCQECLTSLLETAKSRKSKALAIRYRKMRVLGSWL